MNYHLQNLIEGAQGPALQMCSLLGQPAYAPVTTPDGTVPQWMVYAQRMVEHHAMLQALRSFGMAG